MQQRMDEELKRELVRAFCGLIEGWTLAEVLGRAGIHPSRISNLRHGRSAGISIGRLVRMIAALGYDVEVTIRRGRHKPVMRRPQATVVCEVESRSWR